MSADILIVDDQEDIRALIQGILEDEGYSTREAADSTTALSAMAEKKPDLVVLDIWLENSEHDGMEVLKRIVKNDPSLPVIMISGHGNIETAVSAIQLGAYDFIEKPFKADRLLVLAQRAIEAAHLKKENQELRIKASGGGAVLTGSSHSISQVRQAIERVAPSNSRVLLTGKPGTGKEVAARLLHQKSKRAENPYIVLNCAVLRPDHLETELFGTEENNTVKYGVLEQANGGTLFLDEVSDMPMETQGKIVRVLQDQHFTRQGGTERVDVDVRIIASTNQRLDEMMEAGKFRQDLYYRLNVVPIHMPSLADRPEDIPELASFFMQQSAQSANMPVRTLADDAIAIMQSYHWPGNVRQLRNIIEWLLIMAGDTPEQPISGDMLPPEIRQEARDVLAGDSGAEIMSKPLREAREIFEREYLLSQVTRFGGNISKTAGFVGMERSALHRKLKSLGIQANDKDKERAEG